MSDLPSLARLDRLIGLVNAFRRRQALDGSVSEPGEADLRLLEEIVETAAAVYGELGREEQAAALREDAAGWRAAGLDTVPDFTRTRDAFVSPADGELAFVVAPIRTTNSHPPVGQRMECFLTRRHEPRTLSKIAGRYPHPKDNCQATRLVAGSDGFAVGNCIVFFPENVAAVDKPRGQSYALFFFSKFRRIHETYALPAARAVLTPESMPTASAGLDPETCYEARATWGYLHDRFHYEGRWPIDQHVAVKMDWFVGVLEELKVDAKAMRACAGGDVPYADEQIAMILLERVFRYPLASDATRNFDSGTGVFLFSWLRERRALLPVGDRYELDVPRAVSAMDDLVAEVEALEARVRDPDDYRAQAKAMVRGQLAEGTEGARYSFSGEQSVLLRARPELDRLPPLRFGPEEM